MDCVRRARSSTGYATAVPRSRRCRDRLLKMPSLSRLRREFAKTVGWSMSSTMTAQYAKADVFDYVYATACAACVFGDVLIGR